MVNNTKIIAEPAANTIYFTIVGTYHYYGEEIFEAGMPVHLVKDTDNDYDHEAIKVTVPALGKVGYVANSPHTVQGESYSAGRLYDKIADEADGEVMYVLPKGILCKIVAGEDSDGSDAACDNARSTEE